MQEIEEPRIMREATRVQANDFFVYAPVADERSYMINVDKAYEEPFGHIEGRQDVLRDQHRKGVT